MRSMTGYGKAEKECHGMKILCEVSSVNSRYTDVNLNIPSEFEFCRMEILKKVKERIHRGTIFVRFYIEEENGINWEINRNVLEYYAKEIKKMDGEVNFSYLLTLPGVIKEKKKKTDACEEIIETLNHALENLISSKNFEGNNLKKSILRKIEFIEANVEKIENRIKMDIESERKKVEEKLHILKEMGMNLTKEEILLLVNGGVSEEVVRLKSHLQQMKKVLEDETPGRKLLFLTQELQREINTLGSKISNPSLIHEVMELKEKIEEIKEQVMNIE